jgi:hypothetical protein
MKTLSYGSQPPARHSSRARPEYKLEASPLKPTCFRGKLNQILKFPLSINGHRNILCASQTLF